MKAWRGFLPGAGFFLVAAFFPATADVPSAPPAPQETATVSAPITDPAMASARYRQIVSRPEFQDTNESDMNDQLRDWLAQWFTRLGGTFSQFRYAQEMPRFASLLMVLMVIACLGALLYIVGRLLRRRPGWDDLPAETNPARKTFRPPEFYAEELRQAVAAGDWHAAWLASWRQFLSRMETGHLVEADRTRTNREYLAQLRARQLPVSAVALLGGLVDAYDNFIYGQRDIAEPDWRSFHQQVDEATLLLHLQDRVPSPARKPGTP
jgi:hypothetical protein